MTAATSVVWSFEFIALAMMFFDGNMDSPPTITVWSWAARTTTADSTGAMTREVFEFHLGISCCTVGSSQFYGRAGMETELGDCRVIRGNYQLPNYSITQSPVS